MSTWLKGLYYGNTWKQGIKPIPGSPFDFFSEIPKDIFMQQYHIVIDNLIKSPKTKIQVAALTEDPNINLGYCVSHKELPILHWVFVKDDFRRNGIAKSLIPLETKFITHFTRTGLRLKPKHIIFNPFLIGA